MKEGNKLRRLLVLLKNLISIPYRLLFTHISVFAGLQDSKVDKKAAICSMAKFYRSSIGKYSYVGRSTFITNCQIGAFTSISSNCYIGGTSHPLEWVSTSSVFHKWSNILRKNFSDFEYSIFTDTIIGNDVWIGEGCKIKAGVKIANGAVVGMGSIVTKDIGPYEIWAGNPAKLIRKRFSDETINCLLNIKWWKWSEEKIDQYAHLFNDTEKLIECLKRKGEL